MPGASLIDLLLPSRRATWPQIVPMTLVGVLALGFFRPDLVELTGEEFVHDHALLSIDIAVNRAFCDSPSKISNRFRLPYEARDHAELRGRPVREVLVERAGSIEQYCLTIGSPVINNENSLMWLESMMFRLAPSLSLDGLALWLHRLHLAGVLLLGVVALRLGAGLVIAALLSFIALVVLGRIDDLAITVYPLDFVLLMVTAAASALVATRATSRSNRRAMVVAIALGAFAAFGGNLRTSHWPIYALLPIVALLWSERSPGLSWRFRGLRGAALVTGFLVGAAVFQQFAVNRHLPQGLTETAHHTTWHSTVIGLAVPPNDLSRREHLEWSDAAAWSLVQSIDPSVAYISSDYERVLRTYYFGLWSREPAAMRSVYLLKLRTAGVQMIEVLRGSPGRDSNWIWWLLRPAHVLTSGIWVLVAYVGLMGVGLVAIRFGHASGWLVLMLAAIASLVHLESVVIVSNYVPQYHSYLAFALLAASAAAPVLAAAALRGVALSARPRR